MKELEINLKDESLDTLHALMRYSNKSALDINESLQYYNRGMQIFLEKVEMKDYHLDILDKNLEGENLDSLVYLKTIYDDNFQLSTDTIKSLFEVLNQQMIFLKNVVSEIELRNNV